MNPNVNMTNMNPMGGPVGGAPVPMMNNGAVNPQAAAAASAARQQQANDSQRGVLNTYIYEYFLRYGMYECARSVIASGQPVNVQKDGAKGGNSVNGVSDDTMDTDTKDDMDGKHPEDLPPPKLPMPASDSSFLYEWFCLFWDIYNAQRVKGGNGNVNQYVAHTQQQSRLKQTQQQELLRQMRPPDMAQQQYQQMLRMQNGAAAMNMQMKQGNLARTAMANNQNNPQLQMLHQAKQNQMQRDPSAMDGNRERPSSPASGDNAPSPKRPRTGDVPFNGNHPAGMMANGARPGQGMPPQQMPGGPGAAAQQMLAANNINPGQLAPPQFGNFVNIPPTAQQKSIAAYSQHLQHHHGNQIGNKQMPNAPGPQSQGSPMMAQGPDGTAINYTYNPGGEMAAQAGLRPGGPGGAQPGGGSNHALQDYQMQLMLLEQQNKKRLMMARQEQDNIGGVPREGQPPGQAGPGGAVVPNGQPFPEASPQAMRSGTSPNPTEQMKRGTPQMNNSGIPSPVPEGGPQSRGSPNPAMNFMGNADPNMAPHFFKGADGNMAGGQGQMNGMRPPSSHPGQNFNGQMTPQMMAARQQQQQQQQGQQPQPGQSPAQWPQQGPNGQMVPQQMPQNQQVQGTPQQRSMPPPSAPAAAAANANNRTTASPQQAAAAPPTPNQSNKAAPKKKDTKGAKDKRATAKKSNQNLNSGATPAAESTADSEQAAPATPITPVNAGGFKNGQGAANSQPNATSAPAAAAAPQAAPVAPPQSHDPSQNAGLMDNFGGMDFPPLDMTNPLQTGDVLNDFDFDSFLHDGEGDNPPFDFNGAFSGMEGGEIGAD